MGKTKICRYCGNVIYSDAQTCEYCGRYLLKPHDNKDLFCAKCKAPVNTDDNFCQKCGAVFNIVPSDEEYTVMHNMIGIPYHLGILLTSIVVSIAITMFATAGKETTIVGNCIFFSVAFILSEIFLYIYFLPSILAIENNHPNMYFIYVCNLIFGITIIGWFITLGIAMQSKPKIE